MSKLLAIKSLGEKEQKKYRFHYMSSKEFKKYRKDNENVEVIGATRLKVINEKDLKDKETYLFTEKNGKKICFKLKKRESAFRRGYISINEKQFVLYDRFSLFILIPFILFFLFLCFFFGKSPNRQIELDNQKPISTENNSAPEEVRHYDFQTAGSYEISEENPKIKVWNPETNTRIFEYDIYIDGELFSQTKGILPGNMVEIDLSSYLESKGEHELKLDLSVINEETGEIVGQAERDAVLTVR